MAMAQRRWLLPEHVEDILPAEARTLERLRRRLLDLLETHGYELVQPPLLEYTESLLSGTGRDLDLATFRSLTELRDGQLRFAGLASMAVGLVLLALAG